MGLVVQSPQPLGADRICPVGRVRGGLLPPGRGSSPRAGTHVTSSPESPERFTGVRHRGVHGSRWYQLHFVTEAYGGPLFGEQVLLEVLKTTALHLHFLAAQQVNARRVTPSFHHPLYVVVSLACVCKVSNKWITCIGAAPVPSNCAGSRGLETALHVPLGTLQGDGEADARVARGSCRPLSSIVAWSDSSSARARSLCESVCRHEPTQG
jgi:hypothetical protein